MTVYQMIRPLGFEGYENIPATTQGALRRYVENGLAPGGFLTAVLCNDLMDAIARADNDNLRNLKSICLFVYNCIPGDAWGSKERMDAWMQKARNFE